MNWLIFALMTVACWGLYGIFLHAGQVEMQDKVLGRYKAFLFVGIAYFITAVLAPLTVLLVKGADWAMPGKGMWLSLVAGDSWCHRGILCPARNGFRGKGRDEPCGGGHLGDVDYFLWRAVG